MTKTLHDLQSELRGALTGFWDAQLRIEPNGDGLAIAMPLMDASGWQVVVHLAPIAPGQWLLSDLGAIVHMLDDAGKRPDGKKVRELIDAQCKFYGFERNGLVFQQTVRVPFDPTEIQVFAEGLVAISHLCPRTQRLTATKTTAQIEKRISGYFYQRDWTPKRHHKLAGLVEPEIVVDYYWEGARTLAVQPVGRTRHLRGYMEQWGWRWTDLKRAHPDLVKAMVFDPDSQAWDAASTRIGEEVCDLFVPVYEAEAALDEILAA